MSTLYVHPVKMLCNKECSFCITKRQLKDEIKKNSNEFLNVKDLIKNLEIYKEYISENDVDEIEFTGGGEPTLNKDLYEIINFFKVNFPKLKLTIYTNGILSLNIPQVDEINISLNDLEIFSKSDEYFSDMKKKAKIIRVRTYIDVNKISKEQKILLDNLSSDNKKNVMHDSIFPFLKYIDQYVLGKDFETNIMLNDILKDYEFNEKVKLDENIKKCTSMAIIHSDGILYKDWSPIVNENPGYHITQIKKGIYGELSKIYEEVDEIKDAEYQKNNLLILIELSDLVGAIDGYLEKNHPSIDINELIHMSKITKRAFENGSR